MLTILGLGRALTARFLLQPNTVVVAAVRRPEHATSKSLSELPRGKDTTLINVVIDSTSDTDAQDAVKLLQTKHGINKLDVVVANAGHGTVFGDLSQVAPLEVRDLIDINTIGKRAHSSVMVSLATYEAYMNFRPLTSIPGRQTTSRGRYPASVRTHRHTDREHRRDGEVAFSDVRVRRQQGSSALPYEEDPLRKSGADRFCCGSWVQHPFT